MDFSWRPLGWRYAGIVWGYALVWFLLNDRLKLLTYWMLDRSKSQAKTNVKAVDGKTEADTAAKAQPPPGSLDPRRSHWQQPSPQAESDPKPHREATSPLHPKVAAASDQNDPPALDAEPARAHSANTEPARGASVAKAAETNPSSAAGKQVDANSGAMEARTVAGNPAKALTNLTPKLVERVHALYEELGRQDVLAVQEWEQAEKTSRRRRSLMNRPEPAVCAPPWGFDVRRPVH